MAEAQKNNHFWQEDESEIMLFLLKEHNILKYLDGRKTRNGGLFKKVSDQMKDCGFTRTPEQIRIRWKHLKKAYYQARKNNSISGHSRVDCPFGNLLEELLGSRTSSQVEDHVDQDHVDQDHVNDISFESPLDTTGPEAAVAASSPSPSSSSSSSSKRPSSTSGGQPKRKKSRFEMTLEAFTKALCNSKDDNEVLLQMQRAQHAHEEKMFGMMMQSIASLGSRMASAQQPAGHTCPASPPVSSVSADATTSTSTTSTSSDPPSF